MKQKWLLFVTKYNQRILRDKRVWLGPINWHKTRPILLLHATHLFQICWVSKNSS